MVKLVVNGKRVEVDADDDKPLLWVLRDDLHLTGTKFGCGIAQCGACTVHVDGHAKRSCVMPVGEMAGMSITTIEGLSADMLRATDVVVEHSKDTALADAVETIRESIQAKGQAVAPKPDDEIVVELPGATPPPSMFHAVQQAWLVENVPQCGYCQAGQIMSTVALLAANPAPSDDDIDSALSANLCRCGTYPRIRRAVHRAAEAMARK